MIPGFGRTGFGSYKKFAQIICHLSMSSIYYLYIQSSYLVVSCCFPLGRKVRFCFKRLPHGMAKADGRMDPEPAECTSRRARERSVEMAVAKKLYGL